MPSSNKPPIEAAAIPDEWTAMVRKMIADAGMVAPRAGPNCTIELKSLNDKQWHPLMLHGSGTTFTSDAERDLVLGRLVHHTATRGYMGDTTNTPLGPHD